jgi:hypothetical protein
MTINKRGLMSPTANKDDWRYSDERMELRASVFRSLNHYLNDYCRQVYEFCDHWVSQGNRDVTNIDKYFKNYLIEDNALQGYYKACQEGTKKGEEES